MLTRPVMLCLVMLAGGALSDRPADQSLQGTFEESYARWKDYISRPEVMVHSDDPAYIDNAPFQAMVHLGPQAVPLIIGKLKSDRQAHFLVHALTRIAHKRFRRKEPSRGLGNQGLAALWIEWAEGDHQQAPLEFRTALDDWRGRREEGEAILCTETAQVHPRTYEVRTERHLTPLGEAFQTMADMGIEALPLIVEAVDRGQVELVALIPVITGGKVNIVGSPDDDIRQRTCAWWEANKADWLIPWPEQDAQE